MTSILTLCVPNWIPLKMAKDQLLDPFITWIVVNKKIKFYQWKAESSKINGVHFHFVIDGLIEIKEVREKWNGLQKKAGMLDNYFQRQGNYDPDSVDIKYK